MKINKLLISLSIIFGFVFCQSNVFILKNGDKIITNEITNTLSNKMLVLDVNYALILLSSISTNTNSKLNNQNIILQKLISDYIILNKLSDEKISLLKLREKEWVKEKNIYVKINELQENTINKYVKRQKMEPIIKIGCFTLGVSLSVVAILTGRKMVISD